VYFVNFVLAILPSRHLVHVVRHIG